MIDFILLQISVILKHMILKLDISLYFANIALRITLCFLLILVDLLFEVVLNTLLQSSQVTLIFLFNSLEFSHEIMIATNFTLKDLLVLSVGVFKVG